MRQKLDWWKWSRKKFTWKSISFTNTLHTHARAFILSVTFKWNDCLEPLTRANGTVHNMNNKAFNKKGTQLPMMLINFFPSELIVCVHNELTYTILIHSFLAKFNSIFFIATATPCPSTNYVHVSHTQTYLQTYTHTSLHARTNIYKYSYTYTHIRWEKVIEPKMPSCCNTFIQKAKRNFRKQITIRKINHG